MAKKLSKEKHIHRNYDQKNRKQLKARSNFFSVILYLVIGLIVVFLASYFFIFLDKTREINYQPVANIYVSPENPKQGDTVFIRVTTQANNLAGKFNNQNLLFFKKQNSSDWISFLGIDADQKPGDYTISVDTANSEHFIKNIKVSLASFSSAPTATVPAISPMTP